MWSVNQYKVQNNINDYNRKDLETCVLDKSTVSVFEIR